VGATIPQTAALSSAVAYQNGSRGVSEVSNAETPILAIR
jgi:hypothetical protein